MKTRTNQDKLSNENLDCSDCTIVKSVLDFNVNVNKLSNNSDCISNNKNIGKNSNNVASLKSSTSTLHSSNKVSNSFSIIRNYTECLWCLDSTLSRCPVY